MSTDITFQQAVEALATIIYFIRGLSTTAQLKAIQPDMTPGDHASVVLLSPAADVLTWLVNTTLGHKDK